MKQKIEPIQILDGKIGEYLQVYTGYNRLHAMILDANENELFNMYFNCSNKNISDNEYFNWVVQKLNLTIRK